MPGACCCPMAEACSVNLNTWPATIFVGRDGLVKSIHSGFASPASGEFHLQLQQEFTAKIEKLLADRSNSTVADLTVPGSKDLHWGDTR
jgi:hypothetical protein